jgi:HAD superfamily hydrolase (TIGR01484 family)
MRPLAELPRDGIAGLFCDVDDTLTWRGRLVPDAYRALCDAAAAGLRVVPVTGRPGGWAEVLAALWPVEAVVAENGGLAVHSDGNRAFWDPPEVRADQRRRLDALTADVLARFPFARLAEDAALRRVDVAFDIGERQHLSAAERDQLVAAFVAHGARTLVSTVHAHAFFGDHDKAAMLLRLARDRWGEDEHAALGRYLYVGDSPNDQAGFSRFPLSVGVANVARFASELTPPPTYVASREGGFGFAEIVDHLLH